MLTYLQRILWDEATAAQAGRALMIAYAAAVTQGLIPLGKLGWWSGVIAAIVAAYVPSGTPPKAVVQAVKAMSPDEKIVTTAVLAAPLVPSDQVAQAVKP